MTLPTPSRKSAALYLLQSDGSPSARLLASVMVGRKDVVVRLRTRE